MKIKELGEFGLINILSRKLPDTSNMVIKGIGDDTAVVKPHAGKLMLLTTDMIIEEVHFSLRYASFESVGWKALAVNVSDIAAMGGTPSSAVVSIGIPEGMEVKQIERIYIGLSDCAREYGVDIVGGDTVKSPGGLVINIALTGWVAPDKVLYRSGAQPGDYIMVSGPLGRSVAGLYALNNFLSGNDSEMIREVIAVHLFPRARLKEGRFLAEKGLVTSMNDISDGLASEVIEICQASGAGCELYTERIPYTHGVTEIAAIAGKSPLEWALYGGEDFELVFTVCENRIDAVQAAMDKESCLPSIVGRILPTEEGCSLIEGTARKVLTAGGYNHFK
jgi:thiamine-monophosphate kinase